VSAVGPRNVRRSAFNDCYRKSIRRSEPSPQTRVASPNHPDSVIPLSSHVRPPASQRPNLYERSPNLAACSLLSAASLSLQAQTTGVLGDWREPRARSSKSSTAATTSAQRWPPSASRPHPARHQKPRPKSRTHPLCGLQIGYGFHLTDPTHADGGKLYDPNPAKPTTAP